MNEYKYFNEYKIQKQEKTSSVDSSLFVYFFCLI